MATLALLQNRKYFDMLQCYELDVFHEDPQKKKNKLIEEDAIHSNQKGKVNCFHASCAPIAK